MLPDLELQNLEAVVAKLQHSWALVPGEGLLLARMVVEHQVHIQPPWGLRQLRLTQVLILIVLLLHLIHRLDLEDSSHRSTVGMPLHTLLLPQSRMQCLPHLHSLVLVGALTLHPHFLASLARKPLHLDLGHILLPVAHLPHSLVLQVLEKVLDMGLE